MHVVECGITTKNSATSTSSGVEGGGRVYGTYLKLLMNWIFVAMLGVLPPAGVL